MAPKVARGGDGDADIAASPTSAKSTAMRMRGRVVLQVRASPPQFIVVPSIEVCNRSGKSISNLHGPKRST